MGKISCLSLIICMAVIPTIQTTLLLYQAEIQQALRQAVQRHSVDSVPTQGADRAPFYGQMQYHLGWVDSSFNPIPAITGKLLRPTLLLLAYEAAGAWGLTEQASSEINHLRRALPAAVAIELMHNFTLIHDDIVDNDTERHHRPTLWTIWGSSQGINAGDGMFSLARLAMWDILAEGVEGEIAARLGATLDRSTLVISEGQYLDLSFEQREDVSVAMYVDMIARKTAVLMGCAAEMGARLGTREEATIESLRNFGFSLGIAFQVRDDMLGIWASARETGKAPAGDICRRKKSLPILRALERANSQEQRELRELYAQKTPMSAEQVAEVLSIFERSRTREYCLDFLSQQCSQARHALNSVPRLDNAVATNALDHMEMLVGFIEAELGKSFKG